MLELYVSYARPEYQTVKLVSWRGGDSNPSALSEGRRLHNTSPPTTHDRDQYEYAGPAGTYGAGAWRRFFREFRNLILTI